MFKVIAYSNHSLNIEQIVKAERISEVTDTYLASCPKGIYFFITAGSSLVSPSAIKQRLGDVLIVNDLFEHFSFQ